MSALDDMTFILNHAHRMMEADIIGREDPACARFENTCWVYDEHTQVIYLPGTNDPKDVIQDLDLRTEPFMGKSAHRGFALYANTVELGMMQAGIQLQDVQMLVGQSLGGAAAALLSIRWGIPVITFGSPAFWKGASPRDSFRSPCLRIHHRGDPVPGLLRRKHGWHHDQTQELAIGAPMWLLWPLLFLGKSWRVDRFHHMPTYVDALKALASP